MLVIGRHGVSRALVKVVVDVLLARRLDLRIERRPVLLGPAIAARKATTASRSRFPS